jgi:DHA2 family multidrug resistance protein-like MFS transporter
MFHDPLQRTRAISLWGAAFAAGGPIGELTGGVLLEYFWWGSVFLINVPVMALLLLLGPKLLPEFRDRSAERLDLTSAVLSLAAVLSVIYGLKQYAQEGSLELSSVGPALAGLLIGAAFVRRQKMLADPLIDLGLFKVARFSVSVSSNALTGFIGFGMFLFFAQYLQLVVGLSPIEAALWSLPASLSVVVSSVASPAISRLVRPAFGVAGGLLTTGTGLAILTQIDSGTGLGLAVLGSVVFSAGFGPIFILATDLILGTAPPERAGAASAISETGAELGGAVGIAVLGSIGTAVYRSGVIDAVPQGVPILAADAARDTLGGAVVVAGNLPGESGEALLGTAREAFLQGFNIVALTGAIVAVIVATLVAVLLRDVRGSEEESSGGEDDG